MVLYEELLEFSKERINEFFKKVELFEGQFEYNDFNKICLDKMYINNTQENIKTVKELKEEIPELSSMCKKCGAYYMNPRNKSLIK